jgi:CRISPR-associated endoribonuclease Cas6
MKRFLWFFERTDGSGPGWRDRDSLVGWFYSTLAAGNPVLTGEVHGLPRWRPFAFAARPVGEGFGFLLTSLRDDVAEGFRRGLELRDEFVLGGVRYRTEEFVVLPEPRLESPCVFWCASPAVASEPEERDGRLRKRYVSAADRPEEFARRLAENLRRKAGAWLGGGVGARVSLPLGCRKMVVRYKGGVVPAYSGPVVVEGSPKVLLTAACAGLGERTGSGFGAVLLWEEARRGFLPA